MKIRQKMLVSILSPLLLIGIISFLSMSWSWSIFNNAIKQDTLKINSALEMEINEKEAIKDLLDYLESKNPEKQNDFKSNIQDFKDFLNIYQSTPLSDHEKSYLKSLDENLKPFLDIANQVFKLENEQISETSQLSRYIKQSTVDVLDDQWQVNLNKSDRQYDAKKEAVLEIELNLHELFSATRGYMLNQSSETKDKVKDSLLDVDSWFAKLSLLNLNRQESTWLEELKKHKSEIKLAVEKILALESEKAQLMVSLENYSLRMDAILGDKLQSIANAHLELSKSKITWMTFAMILILVAAFGVGSFLSWYISKNLAKPISKLKLAAEDFSKGDVDVDVSVNSSDEIGQLSSVFKSLIDNTKELASSAKKIGEGDFSVEIIPRSEKDLLGLALAKMKGDLQKLEENNEQRIWIKTNTARIIGLSQGQHDLSALMQTVINELSNTLKAGFGAFYMIEDFDKESSDQILKLFASFAYSKRKSISNSFKLGEGLVGQCALERKIISITDVPEEYIHITSGLGSETPKQVIVSPIFHENLIIGVVELATFTPFSDGDCEVINEVSRGLGVIISNVLAHEKTQKLLEESQGMTEKLKEQQEELQTQQEELKASNEELEEKANSLQASEEELRTQSEELRVINEEMAEKTQRLEKQNKEIQATREELEQRAKDLALSSKYKSEFLANVSHELRTPLNSLLILSKKLADNKEGNLNNKQVESARVIYGGGKDLLNLINDILDLSKVEAGKMQIEMTEFNIQSLCDDIRQQMDHVAEESDLQFKIEIDNGVPVSIFSDKLRLTQILRNFLSNAFKFTEKGSVLLRIGLPSTNVSLSGHVYSNDDSVVFSVIDTGIGIPKDKQQEIFEAFQQAEGSTTRKYGGTGLGLAISRAMTDLLGGSIELESIEGQGSRFSIYLPIGERGALATDKVISTDKVTVTDSSETIEVKPEIQDVNISTSQIPELDPNKPTLLVVEDDVAFANIIKDFAEEQKYQCVTSSSGREAIAMAKQIKPSAIVLDLGLPDVDGTIVLSTLKDNPETKDIPVHVISGREESPDILKKGAIGYLKKPADEDALKEVFDRIHQAEGADIKSVLVVEDDLTSQSAIKTLLENKDAEVVTVSNSEAAINQITNNDFDCVILDLNLKTESGFDLLDKLDSSIDQMPNIVIYTGRELSEDEHARLQKYTSSIVVKGSDAPERLLDEVTLFLYSVDQKSGGNSHSTINMINKGNESLVGKKVLLVDDDMRNVYALSSELEDYDMQVIIATNGKLALDKINEEANIDLVLMDIMMPVMDGYEAMKEIRKDSKFKTLPIIALTAKAMSGDREKCIAAGASDYITKPIDTDQLLSMMKVWLSK